MRRALILVIPTALVALGVGVAWSHAAYDRSDPENGETVGSAPDEVWAEYTEPPTPNSDMLILDHCEKRADDGNVEILGFRMTVGMTATHPSTYTVHWRATSALDGHKSFGTFSFTVAGTQAPCAGKDEGPKPEPDPSRPRNGSGSAPEPDRGPSDGPTPSDAPNPPDGGEAPSRAGDERSQPAPSVGDGDVFGPSSAEPIASSGPPLVGTALALGLIPFLLALRRRDG